MAAEAFDPRSKASSTPRRPTSSRWRTVSVRIEKVAFQNFRAYRGRVEIAFPRSTDAERTIYLIGGENGAGKTSMLMALGFAMYGVEADGISYRSGRREQR